MDLQTTPFSDVEKKRKYVFTSFEELGINITMLHEVNTVQNKLPSGNLYKFGVKKGDDFFWYFNGEPVRKINGEKVDRKKMREIYAILHSITKNTDDVPFVFKSK